MPDQNGKTKAKWISTGIEAKGNTKREAKQAMQKILSKLEGYKIYFEKHIRPYFEPRKLTLSKVTPQHIQDYYTLKLKEGLSVSTIKKHNAIFHGALQEAFRKGILAFNPTDRVSLPRQSKQDKKFKGSAYTAEQAIQLLSVLEHDVLKPAVVLGLYYGLRKSEVLGLRWQDIDFESGTLCVRNTVTRMRTRIEHEQTKSLASKRTLFLIPSTITYLQQVRKEQLERQHLLGSAYTLRDHVCVWPDGRPLSPDYVSQHFKLVLEKHKLPPIRFHDLRHTAGSLLLHKGLNIKQVQEFLGHEKSSTTLDIYMHIDADAKQETAFAMEEVLPMGISYICALEDVLEDFLSLL